MDGRLPETDEARYRLDVYQAVKFKDRKTQTYLHDTLSFDLTIRTLSGLKASTTWILTSEPPVCLVRHVERNSANLAQRPSFILHIIPWTTVTLEKGTFEVSLRYQFFIFFGGRSRRVVALRRRFFHSFYSTDCSYD